MGFFMGNEIGSSTADIPQVITENKENNTSNITENNTPAPNPEKPKKEKKKKGKKGKEEKTEEPKKEGEETKKEGENNTPPPPPSDISSSSSSSNIEGEKEKHSYYDIGIDANSTSATNAVETKPAELAVGPQTKQGSNEARNEGNVAKNNITVDTMVVSR